jgi:hypothetical protein
MPEVQQVAEKINYYSPEYQKKVKASLLKMAADINKAAGNGVPVPESKISEYLDAIQTLIPIPTDRTKPNLSDLIREWVLSTDGVFLSTDVAKDLNLSTRVDRGNLSKVLERLRKENLIAKHGDRRGQFRVVDHSMAPMNWKDADVSNTVNLALPLGLHKLMHLYPKNVIVIAGDTNAGKTAYLLNLVRENAGDFKITYFTNDETPEEIRKRVNRFSEAGMDTEPFDKCQFIPRASNFLDVMDPDGVSIIDYLKLTDQFWKVGEEIERIRERLMKGVAIIAIQKDKNAAMGRGGDFAAEAARLYFTLEKNMVNIVKMKNLVDNNKDPNGKSVKFSLWGGCKFVPKGGWIDTPKKFGGGGKKKESTPPERQPGDDDHLDKGGRPDGLPF